MSLAYPIYEKRKVHQLDGFWPMCVIGDEDPDNVDLPKLKYDGRMSVPGLYDTQSGLAGMRGLVAIKKTVRVEAGKRGHLHFGGLGLWARLFVDGKAYGDCHLPYSPWDVSIEASTSEEREIVLLLDNRFGPERALMFDSFFDWYPHGGVYRSITWHELPEVAFSRAAVQTIDPLSGKVEISVAIDGLLNGDIPIIISWDTGTPMSERLIVQNGIATLTSLVPNPKLWQPSSPNLHILRLQMEDGSDSLTERIGLRTISIEDGAILLNDEAIELKGVNRHEYSIHSGPALSDAEIVHDVTLLKEMGANFVRGSHYQQDQRFLDLCDETGIIVWEEGLAWQARTEHFNNPRFTELQEEQLRRMVRASFNHPSIVFWGFLNEGESFLPESQPVYERLTKAIKEIDSSRLVTYACNHPFKCLNLSLCDVISINQYPGWYAENQEDPHPIAEIQKHMDAVLDHLDASGFSKVPKIISEIGAGAIYGCRDTFRGHWSEEYQSDYLEELCRMFNNEERWQGLCIWQFCDCRTKTGALALGRPRSFNNKGLVDEFRRPKQGFHSVKKAFRDQ